MTHPARYCPSKAQKPIRGSLLNRSHPLARGLAACWLMNEGTGLTVFDSSGNGWLGTLNGDPRWERGGVWFDGNDWVACGDMGTVESYPFTFVVRVMMKDDADWYNSFLVQENTGNSGQRVQLYSYQGDLRWNVRNGDDESEITKSGDHRNNTWYHLVGISRASNSHEFYVDGILINTDSTNVPATSVNDTKIAEWAAPAEAYGLSGWVDYAMIYNRDITPDEVVWLHREPYCMF